MLLTPDVSKPLRFSSDLRSTTLNSDNFLLSMEMAPVAILPLYYRLGSDPFFFYVYASDSLFLYALRLYTGSAGT